jgi:sugar lactone lactonase YvrE
MPGQIPNSFDRQVLASNLDHAEGVCWDRTRRCLWVGGEAGQLYRIGIFGTKKVIATIPDGALLGLALDKENFLYVCDPGNHQVWRFDGRTVIEPFGEKIAYPNYAAFGPDGRLYVSDSGSFDEPTGQLFAIDPDGTTTNITPRPIAYANGLCVDATKLWVIESSAPCVSAMNLSGGTLEVVIPMERCVPDGLALDGEGGLLISCYQPNQLWRWTESQGLTLLFEDWTGEYVLSPTNTAFYGEHYDRLALASLCGSKLVSVKLPFAGAPVYYPYQVSESA